MAREAVIEVGDYVVKEAPTGGWRVGLIDEPDYYISLHDDREAALKIAKRYDEARKTVRDPLD